MKSYDTADDRLLTWQEVYNRIGLSRTVIWRLRRSGKFPQPIELATRRLLWRKADIDQWMLALC